MADKNLSVELNVAANFGDVTGATTAIGDLSSALSGLEGKSAIIDGLAASISGLEKAITGAESKIGSLADGISKISKTHISSSKDAARAAKSMGDIGAGAAKAAAGMKDVGAAAKELSAGAGAAKKVKDAIAGVAPAAAKAQKATSDWAQEARKLENISLGQFLGDMRLIESATERATRRMRELNSEMGRMIQRSVGLTPRSTQAALPPGGFSETSFAAMEERVRRAAANIPFAIGPAIVDRSESVTDAKYRSLRPSQPRDIDASFQVRKSLSDILRETSDYAPSGPKALMSGATTGRWSNMDADLAAAQKRATEAAFRLAEGLDRASRAASGSRGGGSIPINGQSNRPYNRSTALSSDFARESVEGEYAGMASGAYDDATYTSSRQRRYSARETQSPDGGYAVNAKFSVLDDEMPKVTSGLARAGNTLADFANATEAVGSAMYKLGDHLQSAGYGGLVNATMIAGIALPAGQSAITTQDLLARNKETLQAGGASDQTVEYLNNRARQSAINYGGDYNQVVGGMYNFSSALPHNVDVNHPQMQKAIGDAYDQVNMLSIAGGAPGRPMDVGDTGRGINAIVSNLGMDTSTPEKFAESYKIAADTVVNAKNLTATEANEFLNAMRAIGPIGKSLGQSPEDVVGLVSTLATQKIVGSSAGNMIKRWYSREVAPTKSTAALEAFVKEKSHGQESIDLFDKNGKARSEIDVAGDAYRFQKKYNLSDRNRNNMNEQLSGLYANSGFDALMNSIKNNGGTAGIRKLGQEVMHGVPGAQQQGVRGAYQARDDFQRSVQKVSNKGADEVYKTFKLMLPELNSILQDVDKLIDGFDRLSDPVKELAVKSTLWFGILSGGLGIVSILGGNFLKATSLVSGFAGGLARVAGALLLGNANMQIVEKGLSGLGGKIVETIGKAAIFPRMGAMIAGIAPAFTAVGEAAAAAWAAIGGPIALVVAGIALLAGAVIGVHALWQNNVGDMQGKWAGFVHGIESGCESVAHAWGAVTSAAGSLAKEVEGELGGILSWIDDAFFGGMLKAGMDAGANFVKGIANAIKNHQDEIKAESDEIDNKIKAESDEMYDEKMARHATGGAPKRTPTGNAADFASAMSFTGRQAPLAGAAAFHIGAPGMVGINLPAPNSPAARSAAASVDAQRAQAAYHPINAGSDGVADSVASPAEQAAVGNAYDAMTAKGPKAKKKKIKITYDVTIDVGNISETDLEKAARALEAKWKGEHHKNQFIDIHDKQGNPVDRVYGDPAAWKQAAKNLTASDSGLKGQAENAIALAKFYHLGVQKEISELEAYLQKAKTQGVRDYLMTQIHDLQAASQEVINKAKEKVGNEHTRFYGTDGTKADPTGGFARSASDNKDDFDGEIDKANTNLKEMIETSKQGTSAVERLKEEYDALKNTVDNLTTRQTALKKIMDDASASLKQTAEDIASITGKDQAAIQARTALNATYNSEKSSLAAIISQYNQETTALGQVTTQMDVMNQKMLTAIANGNNMVGVFQKLAAGNKSAFQTQGGNMLQAGGDAFLGHLFTMNGARSNPESTLAQGYLQSNVAQIAGPLFTQLTGGKPGAQTQDVKDAITNTNTGTIATNTQTMAASQSQTASAIGGMTTVLNQILAAETGQTTANQQNAASATQCLNQILGAEQTTGTNTKGLAGVQQSGGALKVAAATTTISSSGVGGTGGVAGGTTPTGTTAKAVGLAQLLDSQGAKTIGGIGTAAASVIAGEQTGGVAGALTSGLGVYSGLITAGVSNPVTIPIAAAAALAGLVTHQDNPQDMPDKYDTQQYGTDVADLVGAGYNGKAQQGANGQYFVEDQATATSTNNLGEIQYIQQWAAENINNANASVASQAQQLATQWGTYNPNATTANQILTFDPKNIGQETVIGGTEAGEYTALQNAASQAVSSIQSLAGAALTAAQNAQELANSFTANMYGGPSGFSIPYLGSIAGGNAAAAAQLTGASIPGLASAGGSIAQVPAGFAGQGYVNGYGSTPTQQQVTVNILQGATVSNADDVTTAITQNLSVITNAVNQQNFLNQRYLLGYQSVLA